MKNKRKAWILAVCAVLLSVVTVGVTLAYLTSQDAAVNTFTVGNVSITLDEAAVTPDGKPIENVPRVQTNAYHLIPGQTYVKDPTVTVDGDSEEAYVRMLVTINRYEELCAIFGDPFLPEQFVDGWDSAVWMSTNAINVDAAANTATYEFRYVTTVDPNGNDLALVPLFETLTVPGTVTGEQLATIADMEISVVGHAIQAAGFATADAAWTAFDTQV